MAIELKALGNLCNLNCHYCYQNPQKSFPVSKKSYELDSIKKSISRTKGPFVLFGGEPLLMPLDDLEDLFSWGFQKHGKNSIQTNGTLITRQHIDIFKKFNVSVGISIDGPYECNDVRWAGSLEKTRATTAKLEETIRLLCRESMPPRIITTLHRKNASHEKLHFLKKWFLELDTEGISRIRLHLLDVKSHFVQENLALSNEENTKALMFFAKCRKDFVNIRFDIFEDMESLLRGKDRQSSCIWNGCDPYTTLAVCGLEGDGSLSNCGRSNNEGVNFLKAASIGFERQIALMNTEMERGGCNDCRFFIFCKGSCPGSAEEGDWRKRSVYCSIWTVLFEYFEEELLSSGTVPLSKDNLRLKIKKELHEKWSSGTTESLESIILRLKTTGQNNHGKSEGKSSDIQLKNFSAPLIRTSWACEEAREYWGKTLLELADTVRKIRIQALLEQKAKGVILQVNHGDIEDFAKEMDTLGFSILPLQGKIDYIGIGFSGEDMIKNRLLVYNCIVCGKMDLETFNLAYKRNEHRKIFSLLDYPACCAKEFQNHEEGVLDLLDPFKREAKATGQDSPKRLLESIPFFYCVGINFIPYMPCSERCEAAETIGREFEAFGKETGYAPQIERIKEILRWPMEWSFLNGVHELKTPVFKMTYGSNKRGESFFFKSDGTVWPDKGVKGLLYPFNRHAALSAREGVV